MAKAIGFIEKHLSIIVMCVSVLGGISGMWTSVQASNKETTQEKIGLESRLVRLETKVDLILKKIEQR